MPIKHQNKYVGKELEWLDKQYESLQKYIDDNPIGDMSDRIVQLQAGKNIVDKVAATVEQQIKSVRDTIKEMPELLAAISSLREKQEQKEDISVRGKGSIPYMMR